MNQEFVTPNGRPILWPAVPPVIKLAIPDLIIVVVTCYNNTVAPYLVSRNEIDLIVLDMSQDLDEFVEREIATGHFPDRSAVIEHALRLMKRDREEAIMGIEAGLRDADNGRVQTLDEAFNDLRRDFGIADPE